MIIDHTQSTTHNLQPETDENTSLQFSIPKFLNDPEESDYYESYRIIKTYQKF